MRDLRIVLVVGVDVPGASTACHRPHEGNRGNADVNSVHAHRQHAADPRHWLAGKYHH